MDYRAILWRVGRASVAVIIAGVTATYANSPWYLALAPVIQGIGKYLREKGLWNVPI